MPEQIDPPGTNGIQIASAVGIIQPGTLTTHHGNKRGGFMMLHLRARMPDAGQAALCQCHRVWCVHAATTVVATAAALSACASCSICALVCSADKVMRNRAVPLGTVGGQIAGTQMP